MHATLETVDGSRLRGFFVKVVALGIVWMVASKRLLHVLLKRLQNYTHRASLVLIVYVHVWWACGLLPFAGRSKE